MNQKLSSFSDNSSLTVIHGKLYSTSHNEEEAIPV
jgi:hypothetical protein